jgi:hypothetical protein
MLESDWDTIQIKDIKGAKKVTEDQKNKTIEHAVNTWQGMGLTDPEIAFGTTVMGHESAFNPHLKGPSKTERGLGQFTGDTWKDAVNYYNDERKKPENSHWPAVDPVKGRDDHDSQIQVMGPWVRNAWNGAGDIVRDPNVKGYDQKQIAYGKWNQGQNAQADKVGKYLNDKWHDPNIGGYFEPNYDRAMQGLKIRKQRGGNQ